MPHNGVLSRQLLSILAVWIFVGGMAAADLFDLSDELLQPWMTLTQLIEPEVDELDGDSAPTAAVLTRQAFDPAHADHRSAVGSETSPSCASSRPLYQQLAQYRI